MRHKRPRLKHRISKTRSDTGKTERVDVRGTERRTGINVRDSYMCAYCCSEDKLTLDHMTPPSYGGSSDSWEQLTACFKCNYLKGPLPLIPWIRSMADVHLRSAGIQIESEINERIVNILLRARMVVIGDKGKLLFGRITAGSNKGYVRPLYPMPDLMGGDLASFSVLLRRAALLGSIDQALEIKVPSSYWLIGMFACKWTKSHRELVFGAYRAGRRHQKRVPMIHVNVPSNLNYESEISYSKSEFPMIQRIPCDKSYSMYVCYKAKPMDANNTIIVINTKED